MVNFHLLPALYGAAVTANAAMLAGLQEDIPILTSVLMAPLPEATINTTLVTRQTSDDPYCPEGWNCNPQSCTRECPTGQYCLAFGEAKYCIPKEATFCRYDPASTMAAGCSITGAECCHGNCLGSGSDCCNFFDAFCDLEQSACGQCLAGSCGENGCLMPSSATTTTRATSTMTSTSTTTSAPSSTTSSTSATTTTMSTTTRTVTSTTASTTSTTSVATTTTSTAMTTTIPPTPTIIPGVGTFVYKSCLVDIWDARVLVADSDDSESMNVQRCVEFAQSGSWRYAGVEFGTQCYVGNTLHGPDQFPDSDCSQACAGDGSQACGEAGRIQVYEDLTWRNPTIDELITAVERYNATMEDVRALIARYEGHVNELDELLRSQSSRKRQLQAFVNIEMQLRKDYSDAGTVAASEESARRTGTTVLTRGRQRDTIGEANAQVPANIFEQWDDTSNSVSQYLGQIRTRLSKMLTELQRANQAGSVPSIDTAAALAEVKFALTAIGSVLSVVIAKGFFRILDGIWSFFKGLSLPGGTGGGQTSTTTTTGPTTTTSTTTTSTSTCTATATTTPVAIFAASGASTADFRELVDTLPEDPGSVTLTESWLPNYLYAGYVDGCSLEKLADDPIVASWLITQGSQPIWQFDHQGTLSCPLST